VNNDQMQIRASSSQYAAFMDSLVYRDLYEEYTKWLEDARERLETESDPIFMHRLQGVCEAIRKCMELPRIIVEASSANALRRLRNEERTDMELEDL